MKRIWDFQLSGRSVVIMLIGVALNYILFFVTRRFNIPLRLDASGTVYAALSLGPLYGLVTGLIYNLILAFFYNGMNTFWYYYLIGAFLAVIVGACRRGRLIQNLLDICGLVFLCFLVNAVFFTLVAVFIDQGVLGGRYESLIFQLMKNAGFFGWFSSAVSALVTKFFDTVIGAVIVIIAFLLTPEDSYYYF